MPGLKSASKHQHVSWQQTKKEITKTTHTLHTTHATYHTEVAIAGFTGSWMVNNKLVRCRLRYMGTCKNANAC